VPGPGIEPGLSCENRILSPARLPIPPSRHIIKTDKLQFIKNFNKSQSKFHKKNPQTFCADTFRPKTHSKTHSKSHLKPRSKPS